MLDPNAFLATLSINLLEKMQRCAMHTPKQVKAANTLFAAVGGVNNVCIGVRDLILNHGKKEWYAYTGLHHVKEKKGAMLKPCLRSAAEMYALLLEVGVGSFLAGTGHNKANAKVCTVVFAEQDDADFETQMFRISELESASGLKFTRVHSGSKSVHAFLPLSEAVPVDNQQLQRVFKMLTVCLYGDTAITKDFPTRSMRLPGYVHEGYNQKLLDQPSETYTLQQVVEGLSNAFKTKGWPVSTMDDKLVCLELAHTCRVHIKRITAGYYDGDIPSLTKFSNQLAVYDTQHKLGAIGYCKQLDGLFQVYLDKKAEAEAASCPEKAVQLAAQKQVKTEFGHKTSTDKMLTLDPSVDLVVTAGLNQNTVTGKLLAEIFADHAEGAVGVSVRCPSCGYEKDHHACKVYKGKHRVMLKCFHCKATVNFKVDVAFGLGTEKYFWEPYAYVKTQTKYLDSQLVLDALNSQAQVICVKSPKGSGKTTAIFKAFQEYDKQFTTQPVLWSLSHRVVLTRNASARLGMLNYQDVKESSEYIGKSFAICVDSLGNVPHYIPAQYAQDKLGINTPDLIFMDEFSQLGRHVSGSSFGRHSTVESLAVRLESAIANGAKIIIADADLCDDDIAILRSYLGLDAHMKGVKEYIIENTVSKDDFDRRLELIGGDVKPKEARGKVARAAAGFAKQGLRVAVACTDRADADAVYTQVVNTLGSPAGVHLITSHTSAEYKALIEAPDDWCKLHPGLRVLIYSPSLSTGVDLSLPDFFHKVLGLANAGTHTTSAEILQSMTRVRNPFDRTYELFIRGRRLDQDEDLSSVFYSLMVETHNRAVELSNGDPDLLSYLDSMPANLLPMYGVAITRAATHKDQNDMLNTVVERAKLEGWEVLHTDISQYTPEERLANIKWGMDLEQIKRNAKEELISAITDATKSEVKDAVEWAQEVLSYKTVSDDATLACAHKTLLSDTVGDDNIDRDVIKLHLNGRINDVVDGNNIVRGELNIIKYDKIRTARGKKELEAYLRCPYGSSNYLTWKAIGKFLRSFKYKYMGEQKQTIEFTETNKTIKAFPDLLALLRENKATTGGHQTLHAVAAALMRRLGWQTEIIRDPKYNIAVGISVSRASLERMSRICKRQQDKLLSGSSLDFFPLLAEDEQAAYYAYYQEGSDSDALED